MEEEKQEVQKDKKKDQTKIEEEKEETYTKPKPKDSQGHLIIRKKKKVISMLFKFVFRIESILQETSFFCIQKLINLCPDAKSLLSTDHLKEILSPILTCYTQNQGKSFTIPFLQVLRQVLKLLSQCFNHHFFDRL